MTPEKNRQQILALNQSDELVKSIMQEVSDYDAYLSLRMQQGVNMCMTNGIGHKKKNRYKFIIFKKDCQFDTDKTPMLEMKQGDSRKVLLMTAMLTNCVISHEPSTADASFLETFYIYDKGEEVTAGNVISFIELRAHVERLLKIDPVDYLIGPPKNKQ